MADIRKSLVSRVTAAAVIGGTLSLAGVVVASPASAATTSSASQASVLNIAPAHTLEAPICDDFPEPRPRHC